MRLAVVAVSFVRTTKQVHNSYIHHHTSNTHPGHFTDNNKLVGAE
jgi:hypothetical protein